MKPRLWLIIVHVISLLGIHVHTIIGLDLDKDPEPVVVVVEGVAPIIQGNLGSAKSMASQDAYRRAIEEGVGVKIAARTQMEMLAVVSDVVISKSEGFIRNFNLLEEWRDTDDNYHVKIQAEVLRGDIHDDLAGLKILVDYVVGNPVVMIIFQEENMGVIPPYSAAEAEMSKIFSSAGYHLLDNVQIQSIKAKEEELTRKILEGNEEATSVLADRYSADIIVAGEVSTEEFSETYTAQAGLKNATASASVRAIMARTGQVIIAKQGTAKSVHLSAATAGSQAITTCIGEIANQLIYEIPTKLNESRTIKVTVSNCGFAHRNAILESLERQSSVTGVFPRAYSENTAIFDVKTWGSSEKIAEYIDKLEEPDLKVTAVNAGEVKAEVVDNE